MDSVSKTARSRIMSSIRAKHTKPELILRKELRLAGIKYRLHYGKEKIDIAIPERKIAIFADGCFWHQCPRHSHIPKSNKKYWLPKLQKNKNHAKEKDLRLRKRGWATAHFWEHEINKNPKKCALKVFRLTKNTSF